MADGDCSCPKLPSSGKFGTELISVPASSPQGDREFNIDTYNKKYGFQWQLVRVAPKAGR